ncbi:MAG TPA: PQQ-binding-like beta-propeller repeat protein [Prolixibacteraceae bacterium]|nr:PQQ-binding-like beta-propeller repeat protein [Prolixibacteraceae bacterium]
MNSNEDQNMKKETKREWEAILLPTILIAAFFTLLIGLILLFNYIQLKGNDPIDNQTMSALIERLSSDPNNEQLRTEIRAFDLMARKAYFTGKWQIETGGLLLVIGAIVLIVALRSYFKTISLIKSPDQSIIKQQTARWLTSRWLLALGGVFIVLAIMASILSIDHIGNYKPAIELTEQQRQTNVEVVELSLNDETLALPANENDTQETVTETIIEKAENNENLASTSTSEQKETTTEKPTTIKTSYPSLADLQKQYNTFRGTLGHGISKAKNTPVKWNIESGENIVWKTKVPLKGYSSPVIWGNKLFITGANNSERWVYCYNTNKGEMLWQQQAINIPESPSTAPKTTDDTGLAAPSVVTDGNHVVAIFGTGDIIAFDMEGKRLWAKNIGVPDNHYGHSSSLISWKEKVFVQFDTNKGGRLLTLNIQTGDVIWDVSRTNKISWSSPILAEVDGTMQIITSSTPSVAGHDAQTGKELWRIDCLSGEVGPSPGFGNGLVFATNEYATLAAIDPSKGTIVWQDNYYLPEVSSPVVADGMVFIATTYGVFAAFDAHTGNMYWEAEFKEGFYSSPIVVDAKIYAADISGNMHIMKVDREYKLIGSNAMGGKVTTTPAFTDGRMYLRANDYLYCIGK